jgi:pyruvate/2-oxoglutarate dehydrogenase complex dihydrolipoamide acyltransferase (E2) component
MKKDIIMPRCGVDMEEGTVTAWVKKEGDFIQKGEVYLSVETGKAVQDITADYEGYLRKILTPEGETVPVGTVIAVLTTTADEAY